MTPRSSREGGNLREVSTVDQEPENQLAELRRYIGARGWTAVDYVDRGVSGAKERRPALDQLLADAKRRKIRCAGLLAPGSARDARSST